MCIQNPKTRSVAPRRSTEALNEAAERDAARAQQRRGEENRRPLE